jgi:hypothetical protein
MANGWTSERRARQAVRMRTWKPWEKSTGPRSPEGKTASSQNAWKGGTREMLRELARALNGQREALERPAGFRRARL